MYLSSKGPTIRHIDKHKDKSNNFVTLKVIIFGRNTMTDMDSKYEEEADCFASNILIPKADYRRFSPTGHTSEKEIREFASSIGIHPGIVVGRLQHERIIPQNHFASPKEKYKIISGK